MQKYRVLLRDGRVREIRASFFAFERHKSRCGVQARGKIADVCGHRRMPETVESEMIHFLQSLIRGQFFKSHAVAGHKNASPVVAEMAVHENFLLRIVAEDGKKLRDLFVCGRSPAWHRDVNEADSQ